MNILGVSCHYHDAAACLVQDGNVVAAVQEERFNRRKNTSTFPLRAINYCLQKGGITSLDIDYVAFYEKPYLKFQRVVLNHLKSYPFSIHNFLDTMPYWLEERLIVPQVLREEIGYEGKVLFVKHHLAHAASAFLPSPFENAAIITSDGVGEFACMSLGVGKGTGIEMHKELHYPNSLGLLYAAFTSYLGFSANRDEGKVMALASYGTPRYRNEFKSFIDIKKDGSFRLESGFFGFNRGKSMYSHRLVHLLGEPRGEEGELEERHYDIAATLQQVLEEVLISTGTYLHSETKQKNICCAGGTFLNCVANTKLLEETPFENIFIQPAAGDSGGALGAALYAHSVLLNKPKNYKMTSVSLGPSFPDNKIETLLKNKGAKYRKLTSNELVKVVAKEIARNRIVGWFQGGVEWGPRALGNRSILANPCNPDMKDILNEKVKHREHFRPYAVSVLQEDMKDFFTLKQESPYMLLVGNVKQNKAGVIPGAVHIDGTTRIQSVSSKQNPLYYQLIKEYKKLMKVPMIINTSFNDRNEPIVCTPEEAYNCFSNTEIDCLVLGNYFLEKEAVQ